MKKIPETYHLYLEGLNRDLRVVEVVPGKLSIAVLLLATDAELTEAAGLALFHRMPDDVEVLVMPDGKAQSLLHVLQRRTGLPAVLARKSRKTYMREPIIEMQVKSITTTAPQVFHLDADDVATIKGRTVAIIDDVVSQGGTKIAMEDLVGLAGAKKAYVMAVGTEGEKRADVIALHHFPVFLHDA